VGIASGLVIVGDLIGSGASEEAAVVGETPNLAARLQSLAAPNQLVLPEATCRLLNNAFTLKSTGKHTLKGIAGEVEAFVVTGEAARESRFEARNTGHVTPLVGRNHELNLIRDGWAQALSGKGQALLISGEAGIGKSRIVRAALENLEQAEHYRVIFQCSAYHSESAFYPIIHQMQFVSGITVADTDAERLQKLKRIPGVNDSNLPLLSSMLGIESSQPGNEELTPEVQRVRTMQALIKWLVDSAGHKPVLLVFEDLHWIDPTSLEYLELAIDAVGANRVFLLATARPTFSHDFGGHPDVRHYSLNRLDGDNVKWIVDKLTGGKSLPEEVLEIILDRTDGVPLFVEELTKTILESGVVRDTGTDYTLDGPLHALTIPNTLHDSLMARLDRLQPIKEVAQTAACIGKQFSYQLLAKVSSLSDEQLIVALEGLTAAELIYRRGVPPDARYQFKHALVRDAAYESLLRPRRRAIHSAILRTLETEPDVSPEILATHAEAADLTDRAVDLWELASKAAVARPALDEAIAHLSRAISLNAARVDSGSSVAIERALALQVQLGWILMPRRGWAAAETKAAFEKALALAHKVGETPMRFSIVWGLIVVHLNRAEYAEATEIGRNVIEIAEETASSASLVVAHKAAGMLNLVLGKFADSLQHFKTARSHFEPQEHRRLARRYGMDLGVASHGYLSFNMRLRADTKDLAEVFEGCQHSAQQSADINSICFMHFIGSINAILDVDDEALKRHSVALTGYITEHNYAAWTGFVAMSTCLIMLGAGDKAGIDVFKNARPHKSAGHYISSVVLLEIARRVMRVGEVGLAAKIIHNANGYIEMTGEKVAVSDLYRLQAELAIHSEDSENAEALLQQSLEVAREQGARLWEMRAAIDYALLMKEQGKNAQAVAALKQSVAELTEDNNVRERQVVNELISTLSFDVA